MTGNEDSFWQTFLVPVIVAVGKGLKVTVPKAGKLSQFGAAISVTITV